MIPSISKSRLLATSLLTQTPVSAIIYCGIRPEQNKGFEENGGRLDPIDAGTDRNHSRKAQNLPRLPPLPGSVSQLAIVSSKNPKSPSSSAPVAYVTSITPPITPRILRISANKVHFLNIPEASGGKRYCGSSHGWLIILDETPIMLLLNPLTRVKIPLPPLSAFTNVVSFSYFDIGREYTLASLIGHHYNCSLRQMRDSFIKKIVLSSSPVKDSDFTAVAILNQAGVAYCRNGDKSWKIIEGAQSYSEDVVFYKGLFYAVDKGGDIAVCDIDGDKPCVSIIQTPEQFSCDMQYLVSSDEDLLLVTRYLGLEFDFEPHQPHLVYRTTRFEVCRLDWSGPQWQRVRSLHDKVLFIGQNSSLALAASDFLGCAGDCIYYTDDYSEANYDDVYGEHDLGIFRLGDGGIEPLPCYPRNLHYQLQWPPPLWVTPNPC